MSMSKELRVGAFVLAGLIIAGIVVFLVGDEKRLFAPKQPYHTSFSDVQGLKVGAPVRLGGVDIGTVSHVGHGEDAADNRLYVDMHIVRSEAGRIRQSTVAHIVNKGLLGDKMIDLDEGETRSPALPAGSTIKSAEPTDLTNLFSEVGAMTQRASQILQNLETATRSLSDAQLQEDVRGSVHSLHAVLRQISEGNGYVHRLLSDPVEAERVSHFVATIDHTAMELDQTLAEARKVAQEINEGRGFAHEIVYGQRATEALASFGGAAGEVAFTLKGIREGDGLLHSVVYGGPPNTSAHVAENLGAMSDDLRHIVADMRAGKGTVGALLVDPSVYEDLKRVLGDVQRNDVLRALVRYSIKQDEKRSEVGVSGPGPAPSR
jgi:phospholipid/cholesterol/gamma-HCH transport system substrate-binding protein